MKYKYNADLEIQHIGLGDRLANFFHGREALILVREEDYKYYQDGLCFAIASFDKNGFCNNASTHASPNKAWDEFYRIMCEMRQEQPEPEENDDGHVCDGTDDFLRELNGG